MIKYIAIVLISIFSLAAQAQDATAPHFMAFGGKPGIAKLMDDFMPRLMADARMQPFFKDTNQQNFKAQLGAQVCAVLGGDCKYEGPDMKSAHAQMDINKGHFNILVELLQNSMNAQGIAFSAQNALLAKLAPMHRDIINVK
jgi:hemoglobin